MSQDPSQSAPVPPYPENVAGPAPSPTGKGSPGDWYLARVALVLGAWLVALLAAGYKVPLPWFITVFPLGLARILGLKPDSPGETVVLFAAWVIYVPLTIALFFVPQGRAFRTLYVVLLVLLALNVGGCHMSAPGGW